MASYSPAILDDIRAGVDVVDLVGRFVNLRKAGQNYKGLCPFHAEKTPSFMVNPKKGIFHCFGCGVGGDVFGFLMRQDRLSFPEAVRVLAKQANVALPDDRGASAAGDSGREELYRVMDAAAAFYVERLWASGGERAREYLDKRGIDPEVARRFGLGWAPEGWETIRAALTGFGEDALIAAGLLVTRENKPGTYDRFRGRLLFAIRDLQGRVVAFGGRGFGDEQPKYLNSPETPLYSKGNLLYAADLARDSIREKNRALIVEGYVDCLMAHQYGFTETVAALGTAFTAAQLRVLERHCSEVITFFDADAAGQKAAERAEELLKPSEGGLAWGVNRAGAFNGAGSLRVKVALLPAGHDPDTFLRAQGAAGFNERIAGARSLLSYAFDRTIGEVATSPSARVNSFQRVALMLAKVADAEEAAALSREAALKLGVDATQLWIEAQRLQASLRRPATVIGTATTTPAPPIFERDLVALLLASRDARGALLPLLDPAEIVHAGMREIVETIARVPDAEAPALMSELGTDAARHALSALIVDERPLTEDTVVIQQFRRRLERTRLSGRLRSVSQGVAEVQQKASSSAVPMDATIVAELQQQGAELHELVGGSVPSLTPAVESSPDPAGPQGVHTHE